MKKFLLCCVVTMSLPLFGLVWEEDPTITPEARQQRRDQNQRLKEYYMKHGTGLKMEYTSDHFEGGLGSPRLKGPGGERPIVEGTNQQELRDRLEETDGGINQMEEDNHDSDDIDFDDED